MSEIVKEEMLVMVSATANNNKFYHVILDSAGVLTKRWGRVGSDGAQSTASGASERHFESAVNSKKKKGYVSTGIVSSGTTAKSADGAQLEKVAKTVLTTTKGNVELDKLIEKLVAINAHQIIESSGGLIKVSTSGVISTPLGILSSTTLKDAEKILCSIKKPDKVPASQVENYLKLVPQKVPSRRGWDSDFFTTFTTVDKQKEFLKQLSESLKWYEEEEKAQKASLSSDDEIDLAVKYEKLFRSKIDILDSSSAEFARINKYYESSKNYNHHGASRLKLKRVFTLTDESGQETYDSILADIGNERQLWHGTRAFNVLSILRKGLFVPPLNGSIPTVGRMFGPGCYFSPQSSKAANYARGGVWSSGKAENNCFMFLANVALGNEFRPTYFNSTALNKAHNGTDAQGKRFNSISVKGGTCNVLNDEIIVWNTDAINLKYLCEFDI